MPPVPGGVLAHIFIADRRASDAIGFYARAFGAREILRKPAPDGRLMHARLEINGGQLMLCDEFPEYDAKDGAAPQAGPPRGVLMHLQVADCDALYAQAIAAGATHVRIGTAIFGGR